MRIVLSIPSKTDPYLFQSSVCRPFWLGPSIFSRQIAASPKLPPNFDDEIGAKSILPRQIAASLHLRHLGQEPVPRNRLSKEGLPQRGGYPFVVDLFQGRSLPLQVVIRVGGHRPYGDLDLSKADRSLSKRFGAQAKSGRHPVSIFPRQACPADPSKADRNLFPGLFGGSAG